MEFNDGILTIKVTSYLPAVGQMISTVSRTKYDSFKRVKEADGKTFLVINVNAVQDDLNSGVFPSNYQGALNYFVRSALSGNNIEEQGFTQITKGVLEDFKDAIDESSAAFSNDQLDCSLTALGSTSTYDS